MGGYASDSTLHINGRALRDVPFNRLRECHVIGARLTSSTFHLLYFKKWIKPLLSDSGVFQLEIISSMSKRDHSAGYN
jgi:hypothetical protein